MAFEIGNPGAGLRQAANEKLYRKALMLEIKADGDGERILRRIAKKALALACEGEQWAVNHVADRLDGKVPQAIVADDDGSPMVLQVVRYVVEPTQVIDVTAESVQLSTDTPSSTDKASSNPSDISST